MVELYGNGKRKNERTKLNSFEKKRVLHRSFVSIQTKFYFYRSTSPPLSVDTSGITKMRQDRRERKNEKKKFEFHELVYSTYQRYCTVQETYLTVKINSRNGQMTFVWPLALAFPFPFSLTRQPLTYLHSTHDKQ